MPNLTYNRQARLILGRLPPEEVGRMARGEVSEGLIYLDPNDFKSYKLLGWLLRLAAEVER